MDKDIYSLTSPKQRWWPFLVFSLILASGLLLIFFNVEGNQRSPLEPNLGCVVMQDNGDYDNSVNIVFLGTSYNDVKKFQDDSGSMKETFLNTIPYNSYKERFNFFRIENFGDYGCEYNDAVVCEPALAQKEALKCPGGDYIIVLTDRSNIKNFVRHLRSSAWMNLASINAADSPLVFPHEFAHLFADFADEYEYGGKLTWDAPNCDSNILQCPRFSVVEGYECVVGCVNKKHSRSVDVGIMRDYWTSSRYGLYNEWYIENTILESTKEGIGSIKTKGSPKKSPELVYVVSGTCDINENCYIKNVEQGLGYPTKNRLSKTDLVIKNGEFSVNVPKSNRIIIESEPSLNNGRVIFEDSFDFTVAVTIDEKEENIVLEKNGNVEDVYSAIQVSPLGFGQFVDIPQVTQG